MTLVQLNHENMHVQEMQKKKKTFSLLLYLLIKKAFFNTNSHVFHFFDARVVNQIIY